MHSPCCLLPRTPPPCVSVPPSPPVLALKAVPSKDLGTDVWSPGGSLTPQEVADQQAQAESVTPRSTVSGHYSYYDTPMGWMWAPASGCLRVLPRLPACRTASTPVTTSLSEFECCKVGGMCVGWGVIAVVVIGGGVEGGGVGLVMVVVV